LRSRLYWWWQPADGRPHGRGKVKEEREKRKEERKDDVNEV
jgi:hypothetical protein